MSMATFKWLPVVLLVLGLHVPSAFAQSAPGAGQGRRHAPCAAGADRVAVSDATSLNHASGSTSRRSVAQPSAQGL